MQRIEEANRLPGGRGLTGQGRHGSLSYSPPPCPLNSLSPLPVLSPFIGAFSAFLSSACPMLEKLFKISRLGMIMECVYFIV